MLDSLCSGSLRWRYAPVDLAETANTDGLAHVDVAGDGSGADVEPVDVLGRQLVGVCSCQRLRSCPRTKKTYAMS
jgi:hypothetical protein